MAKLAAFLISFGAPFTIFAAKPFQDGPGSGSAGTQAGGIGTFCSGCVGSGGSGSSSGGGSGCPNASVSIEVVVDDGDCQTYPGEVIGSYTCDGQACQATVTRTWSNLPPNTEMDFCRTLVGYPQPLCKDPKPNTNSGSGSDIVSGSPLNCNDVTEHFSISHDCGVSATADASCSKCK